MIRYTVTIECPNIIQDKFAIGCTIGRLIDNNGWELIKTYRDEATKTVITVLGFSSQLGAEKACALMYEEGIAGLTVYSEEVVKSL